MKTFTKLLLQSILAGLLMFPIAQAQMPAAISVEPANATVYDEITLTFDPALACFENGSLAGFPYVAMHSGVTVNGASWQNVVVFNGTGANGQSPILSFNANNTYSITFIPFEFYGFSPGAVVTQICAVFNNGSGWEQDGRDFNGGGPSCMDFFIPINPGNPPSDPYLSSVDPDNGDQGSSLTVQIFGANTHFQSGVNNVWLNLDSEIIDFAGVYAVNDSLISAQLDIPANAIPEVWNVNVYNETDGDLSLPNGFTINDTSTNYLPILTMDPPDAKAYDELTLTLDARLSCPSGSLFDADSVMMHSGVTIDGVTWSYTVNFDTLGANGLAPKLIYNGDTTWSITFTPFLFYGFPTGTVVEAINCVFNGGDWTLGEGKNFDIEGNCADFMMPLETSIGIDEGLAGSVKLYPNPAGDQLNVVTQTDVISYSIYSGMGKILIKVNSVSQHRIQIDLSEFASGIYYIILQTSNKSIEQYKFVKI